MRNISQEAIDLFSKDYRQVARIHFSKGDSEFDITEADIVQGGMTIDRYSVSGSKIEVGSAIAAELTLKLRNYDGKFDDVRFEGAELTVEVGIKKWDAGAWENAQVHWIPCGRFVVDTPPRTLDTISISALDGMVNFDKTVDVNKLHFPAHIDSLIQQICSICDVTLQTDVTQLPNHAYAVGSLTTSDDSSITYRQVLRWCAAITGTCAYMDVDGTLVMSWYESSDYTFTPKERYSSDLLENDIVLSGFTFTDSDGNSYLAGTNDYTLDLSDCSFLTNNQQGVLDELYKARGGFSYRPYEATVKSAPYLFPMDTIQFVDKKGVTHSTIVTHVTFTLNCNTSISGSGETVTSSSYSLSNKGMTERQITANNSKVGKNDIVSTLNESSQTELLNGNKIDLAGCIGEKIWSLSLGEGVMLTNYSFPYQQFSIANIVGKYTFYYIVYKNCTKETYFNGGTYGTCLVPAKVQSGMFSLREVSPLEHYDESLTYTIPSGLFMVFRTFDYWTAGDIVYFEWFNAGVVTANSASGDGQYLVPVTIYGIK
nr:MAG TPA: protein of unknown function DUF5047 [Bacteriophage sp.]